MFVGRRDRGGGAYTFTLFGLKFTSPFPLFLPREGRRGIERSFYSSIAYSPPPSLSSSFFRAKELQPGSLFFPLPPPPEKSGSSLKEGFGSGSFFFLCDRDFVSSSPPDITALFPLALGLTKEREMEEQFILLFFPDVLSPPPFLPRAEIGKKKRRVGAPVGPPGKRFFSFPLFPPQFTPLKVMGDLRERRLFLYSLTLLLSMAFFLLFLFCNRMKRM